MFLQNLFGHEQHLPVHFPPSDVHSPALRSGLSNPVAGFVPNLGLGFVGPPTPPPVVLDLDSREPPRSAGVFASGVLGEADCFSLTGCLGGGATYGHLLPHVRFGHEQHLDALFHFPFCSSH